MTTLPTARRLELRAKLPHAAADRTARLSLDALPQIFCPGDPCAEVAVRNAADVRRAFELFDMAVRMVHPEVCGHDWTSEGLPRDPGRTPGWLARAIEAHRRPHRRITAEERQEIARIQASGTPAEKRALARAPRWKKPDASLLPRLPPALRRMAERVVAARRRRPALPRAA